MVKVNKFKQLRLRAGLSQTEAARLLGVHQTAVSQWELGRSAPRTRTLTKLLKVYDCAADELLVAEVSEIVGEIA